MYKIEERDGFTKQMLQDRFLLLETNLFLILIV